MLEYRNQLAKYCELDGNSRSAVGITAGYNKNYVSNIISGKITPTIEALEALAKTLKIPLAVLLFGDETDETMREIVMGMKQLEPQNQRAVSALVASLSSSQSDSE